MLEADFAVLVAVLFPGSLAWWEYLDNLSINGDLLLPAFFSIQNRQFRIILQSQESPVNIADRQAAHWEAARQLLTAFRPILDTNCPLFARKFASEDAEAITILAMNFTHPGLLMTALKQAT